MQLTHFWLATTPKGGFYKIIIVWILRSIKTMEPVEVETTLDAKMWFELNGDAFPEFIYADLCITPPWESSTYQSTTTDAGN